MAKENLSYVIKRIISIFCTPQHDTVHIEKTGNALDCLLPQIKMLLLCFGKTSEIIPNYSLHVQNSSFATKKRFLSAQSWFHIDLMLHHCSECSLLNELSVQFAQFLDRMVIEVSSVTMHIPTKGNRFVFFLSFATAKKSLKDSINSSSSSLNQSHHILVREA